MAGNQGIQVQEVSSSLQVNSLSLPTGINARRHLDSKKKSDSRNVHPGYSMFEWNVLCQSGQDLTGVGGKLRRVTLEELEKHSTEKDAWTAVRGKVYNITDFMKFHPGGKAQLMRGAGNDCTELYDKIHVWVNSENILEKCLVGVLDVPKRGRHNQKPPSQTLGVNSLGASLKAPAVATNPVLSFQVPTMSVPSNEETLSLQMLTQAKIQASETNEDNDVAVKVPAWVPKPEPQTNTTTLVIVDKDMYTLGTSVDPPVTKYETSV